MNYRQLWTGYCRSLDAYICMQQNKQRLDYDEMLSMSGRLDEMILLLDHQAENTAKILQEEIERRRAELGERFVRYNKRKAWIEGLKNNFEFLQQSLSQMPDSTVG